MFEMIKVMLKVILSVMYLNNNDVTIERQDLVYESLSGNTNVSLNFLWEWFAAKFANTVL